MEENVRNFLKLCLFYSQKGKVCRYFVSKRLVDAKFYFKKLQVILLEIQEEEQNIPVEILGWLYQYYNSERREVVYDGSMKNLKLQKNLFRQRHNYLPQIGLCDILWITL